MKPILVIMAAGLGSRYGGLKQIDKIGPNGEILLELAVHDAIKAGFEKVVFILREEIEEEFKELIGNRLEQYVEVRYAIQRLENLPEGYSIPDGRTKPWGTGQAILCAKDQVDGPFAAINADDFYGQAAFKEIYNLKVKRIEVQKYRDTSDTIKLIYFEPIIIDEPLTFWKKEEIKRGMKHFIGLSNGSYVDCYYKHYKDHVLVMRPNPNAKEVYKPYNYFAMGEEWG